MMKYPSYTCDLVPALELASPASCKTPATLILPTQIITTKKPTNQKLRFNSQQIILSSLGLHTQNPGLREVGFEPRPKRGSDKINMLK